MENKFEIGQEVVAIRTHSKNLFKKGEVFIVRNMRSAPCSRFEYSVDIGFLNTCKVIHCAKCDINIYRDDGIYWFANSNFAALNSNEASAVVSEMEALSTSY